MEVFEECRPGKNCDKPDNGDVECCRGKVRCKRPRCLKDIKPECIFVEKVFDARLFRREREIAADGIVIDITPDLDEVDTAEVDCEIVSFSTAITQMFIDNEEVLPLDTIPGPGGEQTIIPRTFLNSDKCSKRGKGTKMSMRQRLTITFTVGLTVTGTGTKSGIPLDYSGTTDFGGTFMMSVKFDDFCFPPESLFPISVLDSCLANCFYDLASFSFSADADQLTINGDLIFCMFCEKKLKVPVQICVLSTGQCKIKKQNFGFCDRDDFPDVFNVDKCEEEPDMDEMKDKFDIIEELMQELEEDE